MEPLGIDDLIRKLRDRPIDVPAVEVVPAWHALRHGDLLRASWDSSVILVLVTTSTESCIRGHAAEVGRTRDHNVVWWLNENTTSLGTRVTLDPEERDFPPVMFDRRVGRAAADWASRTAEADSIDPRASDGLQERAAFLSTALRADEQTRAFAARVNAMNLQDLQALGIPTQRALQLIRGSAPAPEEAELFATIQQPNLGTARSPEAEAMDLALAQSEFREPVIASAAEAGSTQTAAWWGIHAGALALAARQPAATPVETAKERIRAYLSMNAV